MSRLKLIAWALLIAGLTGAVVAPVNAQKKRADLVELDKLRAEVAKLRADLDAAVREISALKAAAGGGKVLAEQGPLYRGRSAHSWLEQLKDAEPKTRIDALEALGVLAQKDKKLIGMLIETAKNDTGLGVVPSHAVKALGAAGPEALPALIEMVQDKNLRLEAVKEIGNMGPKAKSAVPVLAKALEKETEILTLRALVVTFYRIGPDAKEAIPALVKTLEKCLEDMGKPIIKSETRFGVSPVSLNFSIVTTLKVLDPALAAEVNLPPTSKAMRGLLSQEDQEAWRTFHAVLVTRYLKAK